MKTPAATKPKYLPQWRQTLGNRREYEEAWSRLYRISAKLPRLWKTKTSLQILREVHSH